MCDQSPVASLFSVLLSALIFNFLLWFDSSSSSVFCYFIVTVGQNFLLIKARMRNLIADLPVVSKSGLNISKLEN